MGTGRNLSARDSTHGTVVHRIDPSLFNHLNYFSSQPMIYDRYNTVLGMYFLVYGMVDIKYALLHRGCCLLTLCQTPYSRKYSFFGVFFNLMYARVNNNNINKYNNNDNHDDDVVVVVVDDADDDGDADNDNK